MSRLTRKLNDKEINDYSSKYIKFKYLRIKDYDISRGNYGKITDDQILNKLGQLEDIEEDLGIDLITLFKAQKIDQSIYLLDYDNTIYELDLAIIMSKYIEGYNLIVFDGFDNAYLPLKDYGKTWALTREELI